jgi:predicted acylesterase/phospholipase RssA
VLRHPDAPYSQALARLARRLLRKSIGVALGFGGGRGHGHTAVLRALERLGVRPDVLAGASIGACIAGMYAHGLPLHEIELSMQRLGPLMRRRTLSRHSLMAASGLEQAARGPVPPTVQIEDLPLPCGFVAADLVTGEEVVLRRGSMWQAARASSTIPGLFPPAQRDGRLLVDGAVVSPIPCLAARAMGADVVLGVSLEVQSALMAPVNEDGAARSALAGNDRKGSRPQQRLPTWPAAALRAFDLQVQALTQQCLLAADVPIRVFTPPTSLTDFSGGPAFREAGEQAVAAALDPLRALLPWAGLSPDDLDL